MDDFYFLQISQASSLKEFINFFIPIKFVPFRPISQQLFFFPMQKIFGLNPFAFHFVIFLFHCLNSLLVYKISAYFLKNKIKAKISSLIYMVSPLHFVSLYSITGSYFLFGLFYFLMAFMLWLEYEMKKQKKYYFFSFLFFVLALFSSEISAVFPLLVLAFFGFRKRLKILIPYFTAIGLNLYINLNFAGAPEGNAFQIKLAAFPALFRWYLLRLFGLPEGIKNGYLWEKILIYFLFSILFIILSFSFYKTRLKSKTIIKYIFWIIIAALPFYFMPFHLNPMYCGISFLGFLLLIAKVLKQNFFLYYCLIFIVLSFFSVRLLMHTHWTVRRSKLTENWIKKTLEEQPINLVSDEIVIKTPDKATLDELEISLRQDRAFQLFYNKPDLKTIYELK